MMKKEKKDHPLCIITGTVVHGRGIGKFTGTPTANLAPALETVLPENGVYISKILLDTQTYYGATHIGTRPTVDGNPDAAFTKEQIYEAVWEEPANGCCHAVENTVFQIRKKLRPFSGEYGFIRTLTGYGYSYDPCR